MPESTPPSTSTTASPAPAAAGARSVSQRVREYRLLWYLALATYISDQLTKYWIGRRMPLGTYFEGDGAIPIIRGFCYFVHVGNTGAAWSMFSGAPMVLAMLAALTLLAIFFWRHTLGLQNRVAQVAFGLLCGGIAGNLTDRLLHGHVTDFIDLHFGSYIYPTFNVADSGICVGVFLYIWHSLRTPSAAK